MACVRLAHWNTPLPPQLDPQRPPRPLARPLSQPKSDRPADCAACAPWDPYCRTCARALIARALATRAAMQRRLTSGARVAMRRGRRRHQIVCACWWRVSQRHGCSRGALCWAHLQRERGNLGCTVTGGACLRGPRGPRRPRHRLHGRARRPAASHWGRHRRPGPPRRRPLGCRPPAQGRRAPAGASPPASSAPAHSTQSRRLQAAAAGCGRRGSRAGWRTGGCCAGGPLW